MSTSRTLEVPGYQVVQFLGSGARSTIWQIRDRQTDELFALKRVVKREATDQRYLDQATNEYQVGGRLEHGTIRTMVRMRRIKRWLALREVHLVMEYCHGETLQQHRPESVAEIVRIFGQVAQALAHMNSRGFVHADIKPNNIMISNDGLVKIIDLGQSCPLGAVKERIQGTPDFIAPEQVMRLPLDVRTDVFNFGAAMYWCVTGTAIATILPTKKAVTTLRTERAIVPPEELNSNVPGTLSKLVTDCIEMQRGRRPASMTEVAFRLSLVADKLAAEEEDSQDLGDDTDRPLDNSRDPQSV